MDWRDTCRRQAGVIDRNQLRHAGLTDRAIDGLTSRGDVVAVLPGVYAPRTVPPSPARCHWAAVLWTKGVLSHRSAAAYWSLAVPAHRHTHVIVADRRFRSPVEWLRIHRVVLDRGECTTAGGLIITNRVRTIVDLLRTERYPYARDLRDRSLQQGWLSERDIARSVAQQLGRTGNVQLRRLLAELEPGAQAESERRLHAVLRGAGLTGWRAQYPVRIRGRRYVLDVAFPEAMLAIEVDGRRYHGDDADRFEQDRERQNALVAAGWNVLRFTWSMVVSEPDRVIRQIVQFIHP